MKIAVTGKGGVGKTTFAAVLARMYADEGKKVLCADVDPDANLGLALGFSEEDLAKMLDPKLYIGRCPEQVETFLNEAIRPILKDHEEDLKVSEVELNV